MALIWLLVSACTSTQADAPTPSSSWTSAKPCPSPSAATALKAEGPRLLDSGGHGDVLTVSFGSLGGEPIAISAGAEGKVRFWSLPGFQPVLEPVAGTSALWLGRDVLVSGDKRASVWNPGTRRVVTRLPAPKGVTLHDGLLYVSDGERVRVWDTRARTWRRSLPIRRAEEMAAGTLRGQDILVTHAGLEEPFRLYDRHTGRPVGKPFYSGDEFADPDDLVVIGDTLHYRTYEGLHVADLTAAKPRPSLLVPAGETRFRAALATSDLLIGGRRVPEEQGGDGSLASPIELFSPTGKPLGSLQGHDAGITSLALGTVDGTRVLLSGSEDNTVRLWDPATRRRLGSGPAGAIDGVDHLALADDRLAVAAEENGALQVWDLAEGKPVGARMTGPGSLTSLAVAGSVAVTGHYDPPSVHLWDLNTRKPLAALPGGAVGPLLVTGGRLVGLADRRIHTWDLTARRPLGTFAPPPGTTRLGLFHGEPVAVTLKDNTISVRDVTTHEQVSTFAVPPLVGERSDSPLALGHAGMYGCAPAIVVTRLESTAIRVLDPMTGRDLAPPLTVPRPDESLWTAVLDGTGEVAGHLVAQVTLQLDDIVQHSQLWDLSAGRPIGPSQPTTRRITAFATTPTGTVLVSGPDEKLQAWRLTP
ncbi:WD40 repeat domain-containing protein [Nonomuraea sp. NPDC050663]|uniref:WD40 repeat domain-containing protein n=1 Tax=Nonomuraea sp. NPDC050663 TaxID=3364370 RepID=UPI0037A77257